MKDLSLLVWLTQLGLSVAAPLAGFIFLAIWLQNRFGWGNWALWVGIAFGVLSAVQGFLNSLKTLARIHQKGDPEPSPISFNDHD